MESCSLKSNVSRQRDNIGRIVADVDKLHLTVCIRPLTVDTF